MAAIKSTMYLYQVSPKAFQDLPYKQALQFKLLAAKELIRHLLEPHYTERDNERINAVFNAIRWNTSLLEELK